MRDKSILGVLREIERRNRVPREFLKEKLSNQAWKSKFEEIFFSKVAHHALEVNIHILFTRFCPRSGPDRVFKIKTILGLIFIKKLEKPSIWLMFRSSIKEF